MFLIFYLKTNCLVAVCDTCHARHYAENVVVNSVDTDLGGGRTRDSSGRKDKLKDGVVNSGEVAGTRRLVLLGAKGKRVYVDTSVWVTCVVLVWLNKVEVGTFTLTEAVLSVKLKLSGDDRVLTPAVHVKGSLGENIGSGIRYGRTLSITKE